MTCPVHQSKRLKL